MGLSTWETLEDAGNILLVVPCNWSIGELDSEELNHVRTFLNGSLLLSKTHLGHIHNLDTVVAKLRTNQDIVLVAADFLPQRVLGDVGWGWSAMLLVGNFSICRIRNLQECEVNHLSGAENFDESSSIVHSRGCKN